MPKITEIDEGQTFGKWTVLGCARSRRHRYYKCRCECGAESEVSSRDLSHGRSKQCKRCQAEARKTHGHLVDGKMSPEYKCWVSMRRRCADATEKYYGARGIKVCERWDRSFEAFLEDMGQRPSMAHSLDRIDPAGNYEPGNVRWASKARQARNRSDTVVVTVEDVTMSAADWADKTGIKLATIKNRVRLGFSGADVIAPVGSLEYGSSKRGKRPC